MYRSSNNTNTPGLRLYREGGSGVCDCGGGVGGVGGVVGVVGGVVGCSVLELAFTSAGGCQCACCKWLLGLGRSIELHKVGPQSSDTACTKDTPSFTGSIIQA